MTIINEIRCDRCHGGLPLHEDALRRGVLPPMGWTLVHQNVTPTGDNPATHLCKSCTAALYAWLKKGTER